MTQPLRAALAAMSLLFAAVGGARADTSYLLGIQGGVDERYYPVCRTIDQTPPCNTTVELPWNGTLSIVLDSGADGVYTGNDVLAFDFLTSAGNLRLQSLDFGSVTILDGQVSELSLGTPPDDPAGVFDSVGLHVSFYRAYDAEHQGSDLAFGDLAPVPEPAGAPMIATALACACAWMATRRRGAARRSGRTTPV